MLKTERKLQEIALSQQGFFTAKQAQECGYSKSALTYHVRNGDWERLGRGVYRLAILPEPSRPDLHYIQLATSNREGIVEGVFSRQTALALYDLSELMPRRLHLSVPKSYKRSAQLPGSIVFYKEDLDESDVTEVEGLRVTKPLKTVLDLVREDLVDPAQTELGFRQAYERALISDDAIERAAMTEREREMLKTWTRGAR